MSDAPEMRPRRSARHEPLPDMPGGWRTSRRASKSGKKARKDIKRHEQREKVATVARSTRRTARNVLYLIGVSLAGLVGVVLVLLLVAYGINGFARWNAKRTAESANSPEALAEKAKDNLLLIGVDENARAAGFLALKLDGEQKQIYGIAIPDGAFIEVPGQGFERIGDSYNTGPDVSLAAVSNFFTVPFTKYVVVDYEIYQTALTDQSLAGVIGQSKGTNLSDDDMARFDEAFSAIPTENTALVPLPVKPISVGDQTYFEPQRAEVADLLETWWGVTISDTESVTRVIVYNGSGVPGIAGEAAQLLIRGGYRVVDTKNADKFDYKQTQVVVQNGSVSQAQGIVDVLGVGTVTEQPADQEVADIIIIIGKDFKPADKTTE